MRSCYECAHLQVCSLHQGVEQVIKKNLHFIDVNQPTSSPQSFVHIYKTIAVVCTKFKKG